MATREDGCGSAKGKARGRLWVWKQRTAMTKQEDDHDVQKEDYSGRMTVAVLEEVSTRRAAMAVQEI